MEFHARKKSIHFVMGVFKTFVTKLERYTLVSYHKNKCISNMLC